jgi:hypothetical protein
MVTRRYQSLRQGILPRSPTCGSPSFGEPLARRRVGLRHAACGRSETVAAANSTGMAERAMASVSRKRDRGVIRQRTAERPAARPNTAPTSALPVLSSASSAGCNTSSGCLVGTDAPRSMKPSSHSAADEAGSRTDHWQEAGSRRESMSAAFGGTAAIETRQPCRGHASYSSAVLCARTHATDGG